MTAETPRSDDVPTAPPDTDSVADEPIPQATDEDAIPKESPQQQSPKGDDRDRRIWWTLVAIGVLILVIVVLLGRPLVAKRLDAARNLDTATQLIANAKADVNSVDVLVRAKVSTQTAAASTETSPTIGKASKQLNKAVLLLDAAYPSLNDDEQRRAALVKTTALARIEMLNQAPVILAFGAEAAAAAPLAEQAWAKTLAADTLADQAVAQSNRQTKAGWNAATALNTQAEQGFMAARDLFSQATTAFPEADLGRYVVYCDLRLAQTRLSKQADAANLAGNTALANSLTAAYNAADAKSTAAAAQLPVPPAKAIAEGFKLSAESSSNKYFKARKQAEAADKALTDF